MVSGAAAADAVARAPGHAVAARRAASGAGGRQAGPAGARRARSGGWTGQFPHRHGAGGRGDVFPAPRCARQLAAEIEAQFEAFAATGLKLDHVNAHKHFHLHPTIAALMVKARHAPWREGRARAAGAAGRACGRSNSTRPSPPWRSDHAFRTRACARRFRRAGIAAPDQVFGLAWSGAMTHAAAEGADRASARRAFGDLSASRHRPLSGFRARLCLWRGTARL